VLASNPTTSRDAPSTWTQRRRNFVSREFEIFEHRPEASEWVGETLGLLAVIGEQLYVSLAAGAEVAVAEKFTQADPIDPVIRAAGARSMRFFLEGQVNALTVLGHSVANLTARTLAISGGEGEHIAPTFVPRSHSRDAWLSLTAGDVKNLRKMADGLGRFDKELVELTAALQAGAWGFMYDERNVQYHRWRGEADGMNGVSFGGPTVRQRWSDPEGIDMYPTYEEGAATVAELRLLVGATVAQLCDWMPAYLSCWDACFDLARAPQV
jgi:hypothetical protein